MDLSTNEKEAGSVDPTSRESSDTVSDTASDSGGGGGLKICADCQTTKTPLWRAGPNGPKSLCNACGIRFRKRRRREGEGERLGIVEKLRRQRSPWGGVSRRRRRRKEKNWSTILGEEEEQAALLLMALSTKPFL